MDGRLNPTDESLAAARLHVQALTEGGLPREALLQALLEQYEGSQQPISPGHRQDGPAAYTQRLMGGRGHTPRLSVSTTNSASTTRSTMSAVSNMSAVSAASTVSSVSSRSSRYSQTPCLPPSRPVTSTRAYWCTSCETKFIRKFDWKRHEDEFHERYKKYPCPDCNRVFWGSNTFNQHHKARHGCKTCPHADSVVKYMKKKRAWGCGFCAAFLPTMDRYYDHVSLHFEAGRTKAHWYHSNVIYGLLHQPSLYDVWKGLVSAHHGHLPKDQRPSFYWDAKNTGRAQGYLENESPGQLQDFLEFFNPARDDAQQICQLAFEKAALSDGSTKVKTEGESQVDQLQHQPLSPVGTPTPAVSPWPTGEQMQLPPGTPSSAEFRVSAAPLPLFSQPPPPPPPADPASTEPLTLFNPMPAGMSMPSEPPAQMRPDLCPPQMQQHIHQQMQPPPHRLPPQQCPPPPPQQQQQQQQQQRQQPPQHAPPPQAHMLPPQQVPQQMQAPPPSLDVLSFMGNEPFLPSAPMNLYEDWNSIATTVMDGQFAAMPPHPDSMDWSASHFPSNTVPSQGPGQGPR